MTKVGRSYRFTPHAFIDSEKERSGPYQLEKAVTGRVVYVHPQGRYFIAEAKVNGHIIREAFKA